MEKENENIYLQSMNALINYIRNNEKNPNEKEWNKYAIDRKYLSSKAIGYLSGMGFNVLCKKTRKQINRKINKEPNLI